MSYPSASFSLVQHLLQHIQLDLYLQVKTPAQRSCIAHPDMPHLEGLNMAQHGLTQHVLTLYSIA